MLWFAVRRFVQAIVALLFVTVVVFLMSRATGDPVGLMVGPTATEEQIENLRRSLGLLEPLHVQYTIYLRDIAVGDFGESIRFKVPVMDLIADFPSGVSHPRTHRHCVRAFHWHSSWGLVGDPEGLLAGCRCQDSWPS